MANRRLLIEGKTGQIEPRILWAFGVGADIRTPARMPADFHRHPDDVLKLEADVWAILRERQKLAPVEDVIECGCGRNIPAFPDLDCCPFCGIEFVEVDESEDEEVEAEEDDASESLATVEAAAQSRLEMIENEIARLNASDVRSRWERGRLLSQIRDGEMYRERGIETFVEYLESCSIAQTVAYRLMARSPSMASIGNSSGWH